jgi:pilus assembly protein CpaE
MELVEAICSRKPTATVMVYSGGPDAERMMRSMRAGAREFLSGNFAPALLQEALLRAAVRRSEQATKKATGKLLVFWGAKGGSGVTTLAANFAIALREETAAEVALVDLNPRLGDVAVLLGMTPRFTVAEALQNGKRLDQEFVSTLLAEHSSGISVLAAPDAYQASVAAESRTVGKLADVVRNQYPYVVVDAGRELGAAAEPLFQMASVTYLVTQLDIPSLRNTQRFIAHMQQSANQRMEVVVNRFDARNREFDDERVSKALGVRPRWKVPNDYMAVHGSANSGSPFVLQKSPASQAVRAMARAASGKTPVVEKKKRVFSLFG